MNEPLRMLRTSDVAKRLKVSVRTLERWRADGGGPDWVRLSTGIVRYPESKVDEYWRSRVRRCG